MAKWVTGVGTWRDSHCVLTRAGFLHCLADMGEALPQDSICLANTAFVTGDAPEFQLIETTPARVSVFARQRGELLSCWDLRLVHAADRPGAEKRMILESWGRTGCNLELG